MYKRSRSILNKLLLFSLVAGATLAMLGCGRTQAAAPSPPPEVRVAPPIQQDVPVYSDWVATLDGYVNAQVRPQVSGRSTTWQEHSGCGARHTSCEGQGYRSESIR